MLSDLAFVATKKELPFRPGRFMVKPNGSSAKFWASFGLDALRGD